MSWLMTIGLIIGLPLVAPALTTTPIPVISTVDQAIFIYDADSIPAITDSALTGSEATTQPLPYFGLMPGLAAAEGAIKYPPNRGFMPGGSLYYMRHREYSADMARFLQVDPLGIQGGLNLYVYGSDNPLAFLDSLGLCSIQQDDGYRIGADYTAGMIGREEFITRWQDKPLVGPAVHATVSFQNGQYVQSALYTADTAVQAYLAVAGVRRLAPVEDTANRAFWMGQDGLAAAEANGANVLRLSEAAQAAFDAGDYSLMQAESAAWAAGATGDASVYVGNGLGRTFWNQELPELLNGADQQIDRRNAEGVP